MFTFNKCENCGSETASRVRLDSASSRIIWWNHGTIDRNLCGGCAEISYIAMQRRTLIQGWWGPLSALATVFFGIRNIKNITEHRRIINTIDTGNGSTKRFHLLARNDNAAVIASIIAIIIWASIGYAIYTAENPPIDSSPSTYLGTCWEDAGNNQLSLTSCSSSTARYIVHELVASPNECSGTYITAGFEYACLNERT